MERRTPTRDAAQREHNPCRSNGKPSQIRAGAVDSSGNLKSSLEGNCESRSYCRQGSTLRRTLLQFLLFTTLTSIIPVAGAADGPTGLEHLRAGRVDEALAVFKGRLESNPDDVMALNMVGAILCMKDEPGPSIAYFERALRHSPDFVPARKNLAIAEFDLGRFESAEANLRKLLAVPESREQASLFLGMIRSESGRHDEAVRLLEKAGTLTDGQPRSLIAYARSLERTGRADSAKKVLAAVQERGDLTGPDLVDLAQISVAAGLFDEALAALQRAEAIDPTLEGLGNRTITVLVAAGRDEEALGLARRLSAGTPDRTLLSRHAELEEAAGNLDAAIMALRKAIQIDPGNEEGYIELSEFCVRYRNPELALEILDLGMKRAPSSYRLLVQKGITLGQGQRYELAREAFADAIRLQPDHSVALTALAVSLIHLEEMPEALEALRAGVRRFPEDFYVHYIYGFAINRSREESGDEGWETLAEKHLRSSIKLNGKFPSSYYRLGKLLAETDTAEAIRNLEVAVRLDPSLTAAKYQLGQLYLESGRERDGTRLMREIGEAKQRELEEEQMPQFRAVKTASNH